MNRAATVCLTLVVAWSAAVYAEPPDAAVAPATFDQAATAKQPAADADVELTRQHARHRGGRPEALAQVIQLAARFDDSIKAELIDELAAAHVRAGNLDLAAETRRVLAERFPAQPQGRQAVLWLVRLYASSEVSHAHRTPSDAEANLRRQLSPKLQAALRSASAARDATPGAADSAASTQPPAEAADRAQEATAIECDPGALYALDYASRAVMTHPDLADHPALALQRSAAARRAGELKTAQALLSPLKRRRAGDPWARCARAEEWLQDSRGDACPQPIVPCLFASAPPRLDGVLDEPCWQRETPAPTTQSTPENGDKANIKQPPAPDVRWSYDDKFLYVAVRCAKLEGVEYPHDDRPRPRDGNVETCDRVRLLIDLDRDYATWFELVSDSRGWTADRCWNDAAWNPQWFVAAAESEQQWTIEAAIPLAELSARPLTDRAAWTCAAERLTPHSPAPPTSEPPPEVFSLLLFD